MNDNLPHLCACIVQHSWRWRVSLNGRNIDDSAAFAHVLDSSLSHAEVVQDVAVEGELHSLSADILEVLHILALKTGVVD